MREGKELLGARVSQLWSTQQQLINAIPKIAEQASPEVRDVLGDEFALTKEQISRLERAAELLGTEIRPTEFGIMASVIEEGMPAESSDTGSLDREVLSLAQLTKSIGIRGMGRARVLAERLGAKDVAELLEACLQEEYRAEEIIIRALERCALERSSAADIRLAGAAARAGTRRRT